MNGLGDNYVDKHRYRAYLYPHLPGAARLACGR